MVDYKQTDIGCIPKDWDVKKLGSILQSTQLGGNYPNTESITKYPLIKMGNLARGYIDLSKIEYVSNGIIPTYRDKLSYGNVIFNTRNTLDLVGKVSIWRDELQSAYFNSNIMRLKFKKQFVSSDFFINNIFNSKNLISQLRNIATGTTSVAAIYTRDLINIQIPLPPLKEQEAIAEVLSDADALITALEKRIAKKRLIKQGAMQKLLSPKDDWEVKKLGEVASIIKGKGLPKSALVVEGKYKCIHYGELFIKYKEKIIEYLSYTDKKDDCFYSKRNDVLMPTSDVTPNGLATASCVLEDNVIIGGDILVIRIPENVINGIFLSYSIKKSREQVMKLVTGSTVYHIYGSDMANFVFKYPKIEEQNRIATILSDIDNEIDALEKKLAKTKKLKQGLMQQLLTGKIRLV